MQRSEHALGAGEAGESVPLEIGDQLKTLFGRMTTEPMPKRLLDLADALEEAFQRGELFDQVVPPQSRAS